jgi:hypothetical protein
VDTVYIFGDTQPDNRFHIAIMRKNLSRQLNKFTSHMVERVSAAYKAKMAGE